MRVPELPTSDAGAPPADGGPAPVGVPTLVTDEDRNRYGVLLDHAAERGLLSPAEYQTRLAEVAEASSVDELQRIVTELPAFGATPVIRPAVGRPTPVPGAGDPGPAVMQPVSTQPGPVLEVPPELDATLWAARTAPVARRRTSNPWLILGVLVVLMLVSLVTLALVASHLAHTHHAGLHSVMTVDVSRLRL